MQDFLKITKALADGGRLRIIAALMTENELCVCQITELLGLATATVSRHISILQNAGLVDSRKQGRWVLCRLSPDFPEPLAAWIRQDLMGNRTIKEDLENLRTIVACNLEELCARGRCAGKK